MHKEFVLSLPFEEYTDMLVSAWHMVRTQANLKNEYQETHFWL